MARLKADYSEVDKFKPLTPGDYLLRIETAEATRTDKGDPMIKLEFSVEGQDNKKVWANLTLSRAAAQHSAQFFKCIHIHPESIKSMRDLMGEKVWAKIGLGKPHNGKRNNAVVCYLDLSIPGQGDEDSECDEQ